MTTDALGRSHGLGPTKQQKFTRRVLPFIVMAALLAGIPFLGPSRTAYSLLNVVGINVVFALSYNMLLGQTGLLSFGHAVYFGLGGYGAMHAMNWIERAASDGGVWASYPVFALPLFGFACGALAGAIIGWPSCRRAGVPFAMISLGIAELVAAAGFISVSLFGGEEGISGDRVNGVRLLGLSLGPVAEVYWFIAFWSLVGAVGMYAFTRTPLGKMAQAVRDNPERVRFVGYDPQRVRYLVFIASGGFAGLAGGMAAVNFEIFTPESLSLVPSGFVLLMAYVGGTRYFAGPILGAILLTYMQSNLSDYSEAWLLYLGLLFVTVILFAPGGLAGMVVGLMEGVLRPGSKVPILDWMGMLAAGLAALAGGISIIEVTVRVTNGFGEVFEPFGIALPPDNPLTWILSLVLLGAGLWSLRRISKRVAAS